MGHHSPCRKELTPGAALRSGTAAFTAARLRTDMSARQRCRTRTRVLKRIHRRRDLRTSLQSQLTNTKNDIRVGIARSLGGPGETGAGGDVRIRIDLEHEEIAARVGAHVDAAVVAAADAAIGPEGHGLDPVLQPLSERRRADRLGGPEVFAFLVPLGAVADDPGLALGQAAE